MSDDNEVTFTRPTAQVDLERRLEADHKVARTAPDPSTVDAPYATEDTDTSAYVGVSQEYMTHANETEKPFDFDGVEGDSVEAMTKNTFAVGTVEEKEGKQTLGGGSLGESVVTATSGENLTSEVRKATAQDAPAKPAPTKAVPAKTAEPAKS